MPDYSTAALLDGINGGRTSGSIATELSLGGMSTGGDICGQIASPSGNMSIGAGWYGLSVTLEEKPSGQPYGMANSTLRSLANAPGSVVTYYFNGSVGIDANLIDSTAIDQTDTQLGFSSAVDIQALDRGMGAIAGDPEGDRTHLTSPVRDRFYFTVAGDWTTLNPSHIVVLSGGGGFVLSPDTIYVMHWGAHAAPDAFSWSSPQVAFTPLELFGSSPVPGIEIDAISVWSKPETVIHRVVFSAKGNTLPNQIMGYDRKSMQLANGIAVPLSDHNGNLISDKMGIDPIGPQPEDVNGLCGIDPESGILSGALGFSLEQTNGGKPEDLGLSMYRSIERNGAGVPEDWLTVQATGISQSAGVGLVLFQFAFFDAAILPIENVSSLTWFDFMWVAVSDAPTTVELPPIPGNLPLQGPLAFRAHHVLRYGGPVYRMSEITALNY